MTLFSIDTARMTDFLVGLLNIPSPTGYTDDAIRYVEERFRTLNIEGIQFRHTKRGALLIDIPGTAQDAPRALAAHVDTLGAMVASIKGNGKLTLTRIGGYSWTAIENETVTIRTANNGTYRGTILLNHPSSHASRDVNDSKRDETTLQVRIDARTTSAAETRALGIDVGDFVFLDPRVEVTSTGFIRSRHLDDKASVAAVWAALAALQSTNVTPTQPITILIAVHEEVGSGAVTGFPPNLAEFLAVDMAVLGDYQNSDEFTVGICSKDSSGPYDYAMVRKLAQLASDHEIPYKLDVYPYYGSDAGSFIRSGGDALIGLIGPGVDASHSYERTHLDGLSHTSHLIAQYFVS